MRRFLGLAAVGFATLLSLTATASADSGCAAQATVGFAALKLLGTGCITTNGSRQTTPAGVPALVNGLELHPSAGASLTLDSAAGTLSSGGGNVTVDVGEAALGQKQTAFQPQPINWRINPNPGETAINEGSAGRFQVSIGGQLLNLPPLSINGITLTNGQSDANFTVGVPLPPGVTSFFGTVKATATVLSDNPTGAHFDGLDATIALTQKPELSGVKVAAPFAALYGHLQFRLSTNTWNVSLIFTVPGAGGISGETQIVNGKPTKISFAANYNTPGLALGNTGAFLQQVNGSFTHYPHYSRPRIGLTQRTGVAATDASRAAECADINTHYDQYIALNKAFPSYCGTVGTISFDPPLEVGGGVRISAGPVIGKNSALLVNGGFRYVDSYFDGSNNVPWAFNVQGGVTMVGLPFNRSTVQVYPTGNYQNQTKFAPIDNSGTKAWLEIHGDGLVEAGGGFDYSFPQNTDNWLFSVNGQAAVSLIPKGAAIGSPPAGATPAQYASAVQGHANNWTVLGTVTGQVCAQIPKVAKGCATAAAGISNNGVAGCASFSLPGTQVVQAIAIGAAKAINGIARAGQAAGQALKPVFNTLGRGAVAAASSTKKFFVNVGSNIASGAKSVGNKIGDGLKDTGKKIASFFGFTRNQPLATAAANEVINENIVIPNVNYSIGAVYRWSNGSTQPITSCSHAALQRALSASDLARAAAAGMASTQVLVRSETIAPRMFMVRGVSAAPDVLVMGPDDRAIRTDGPGFIEPGWIVYKDPALKTTYVDAVAAPPGRWDFVATPGTSLIANIETAAGESIPTVAAGLVSVKGRVFAISYRVSGEAPGDVITLAETDGSGATIPFARLLGRNGIARYAPSPELPSSNRVILALVTRGATQVSAQPVTAINLKQVAG